MHLYLEISNAIGLEKFEALHEIVTWPSMVVLNVRYTDRMFMDSLAVEPST